jgi:hypothetical protein
MTEYFVKSRVVWQLGPGKSSMIVPLRQLNVGRVVSLLKHPWVLEAIWKMWWDYPFMTDFCVQSRMVWLVEHPRVLDAIWKM